LVQGRSTSLCAWTCAACCASRMAIKKCPQHTQPPRPPSQRPRLLVLDRGQVHAVLADAQQHRLLPSGHRDERDRERRHHGRRQGLGPLGDFRRYFEDILTTPLPCAKECASAAACFALALRGGGMTGGGEGRRCARCGTTTGFCRADWSAGTGERGAERAQQPGSEEWQSRMADQGDASASVVEEEQEEEEQAPVRRARGPAVGGACGERGWARRSWPLQGRLGAAPRLPPPSRRQVKSAAEVMKEQEAMMMAKYGGMKPKKKGAAAMLGGAKVRKGLSGAGRPPHPCCGGRRAGARERGGGGGRG
jgi:hypothetical protein